METLVDGKHSTGLIGLHEKPYSAEAMFEKMSF